MGFTVLLPFPIPLPSKGFGLRWKGERGSRNTVSRVDIITGETNGLSLDTFCISTYPIRPLRVGPRVEEVRSGRRQEECKTGDVLMGMKTIFLYSSTEFAVERVRIAPS